MPVFDPRWFIVAGLILVGTACTSKASTLLLEAENLWFKSHYREAVRIFLHVVDRYPESKEAETALLRTGETFMLNLSDPQKAIEYFTRITNEYPNGEKALIARESIAGIFEKTLKDYERAVIQYQKLIDDKNSREPDKHQLSIGRCYYGKGDYQQAIVEFNTLIERYPGSKLVQEAKYQIGNSYFVMNDCKSSNRQYRKVLEDHPDIKSRYEILLSIGVCMEESEEYGQALKIYREILDKYKNKRLIEKKIDAVLARMRSKNR